MKKNSLVLLSLIFLLAFILGARMILAGDFFYLFDQARDYLLTKNIVNAHSLALIGTHSGLGGFFHGPLWLYMLAPVYILGKGDPFTFTYFYIGLQLFTVFAAFVCGAKLYGNKTGLLFSLLIALSPLTWQVVPNTIGVNVEPLIFIGLFYFLTKFIRGNTKFFILAAFFVGLSLQFETALPLVLIPSIIAIFILSKKPIKNFRLISLSLISYILSVSTFILFDLRHSFLMTKAFLSVFGGGEKGKGYLEISQRIPAHLESLLGVYKSVLFNESILLVFIFAAILLMAIVYVAKNKTYKYRQEFFLFLLFPVLNYVFFLFYPYNVWPPYVLGLLVPVAFVLCLSINIIWKFPPGKMLVILFFIVTFFNVFLFINNQYLKPYPRSESAGSYINQEAVIDWIYKDAGRGTFGYFVYTPEIYTHGTDYLLSWWHAKYPQTTFENKKDKITYLILAPHLANDDGAYDFWKKNVLRTTGKVIFAKVFRGGITVEKLLITGSEAQIDPNYYQGLLFR